MMNQIIDYYDNNALDFYNATYQVDMDTLYQPFLQYLSSGAKILDLGCGSGRDSLAFKRKGYDVECTDYSLELIKSVHQHTGLDIRYESFYDLSEEDKYNGVWACASLLHCDRKRLPEVLNRITIALKVNGVCYMSFKYGDTDRQKDGRHFTDLNEVQSAELLGKFNNIDLLQQWITFDKRPDRNEKWLNIIFKKQS